MKILSNASVTKLKELYKSYGGVETIEVPFIRVNSDSIDLLSSEGYHVRSMRIGTKLLIDFKGIEISEKAFARRIIKAIKVADALKVERQLDIARIRSISHSQAMLWETFLMSNPGKIAKYLSKSNKMQASKWRNLLRMKAAKYINDGSFNGLEVSAYDLIKVLISINVTI